MQRRWNTSTMDKTNCETCIYAKEIKFSNQKWYQCVQGFDTNNNLCFVYKKDPNKTPKGDK